MNSLSERIRRLCELLFSEIQQREAARKLGVAQPLLSRTLSGAREPSRTLIEHLLDYPGVNPRWLLDGYGEPLFEGGTTLPVIPRLPDHPKANWRDLALNAEQFRVADVQFTEFRYWWKLEESTLRQFGDLASRCKAKTGDYLLLETDRFQIESMPLGQHLAIATHPDLLEGKPQLGLLRSDRSFIPYDKAPISRTADKSTMLKLTERRKVKRKIKMGGANNWDSPSKQSGAEKQQPSLKQVNKQKVNLGDAKEATKKTVKVQVNDDQIMAVVIEMVSTTVIV